MNEVYILEECAFYDGHWILFMSEDYNKVKALFDKKIKEGQSQYGYNIIKIELDVEYEPLESGITIDSIGIHDDNILRIFRKNAKDIYKDIQRNEYLGEDKNDRKDG